MTEQTMREALRLVEEHGNASEAARALGISRGALNHRLRKARDAGLHLSDGASSAMQAANLNGMEAKSGWRVIQHEDGSRDSVYWKAPEVDTTDDFLDRVAARFENIPAADPVPAPAHRAKDLLTLYPIADAHIGMLAWGKETGEDYNTEIACKRLTTWMGQAIQASPPSETAVVLDVGDLTHADDQTNQTPGSKHQLDVDTRHFRTLDMTIDTMVAATNLALRKHKRVIVRIIPGNHNKESWRTILFALSRHYRDEKRVEVQVDPMEFFAMQFGNCMLTAHHGDKAKAERMVMFLAETFPAMWGSTKYRYLWTGHLHHHKSADIGGVQWEQLRALTAKDAYAFNHAYCASAQLQAITYHKEKGEVGRVKVAA
ncbi:MAG: winged helix-turn-helix domain-containing protein [Pikeienuella sp.]